MGVTSFLVAVRDVFHNPTGKRSVVAYLILIAVLGVLVGCPTALEPNDSAERNYDLEPPIEPGTTPPTLANEYDTLLQWAWTGSGGGTGYFRVRLNHADAWEEGATSPWPNPAVDQYPGVYIFEVQERDSAGNWSEISGEVTTVKVREPIITAAPTGYVSTNQPTFEWSQYAPIQYGAADVYPYSLEERVDGAWVPIDDLTGTLDPSLLAVPLTGQGEYTASRALPDGEYRFCVAERNGGGARSDFVTATFTVDTTPPKPPAISGPAAVSEASPWQTYTWTSDSSDTLGSYNWELRDAVDALVDSATGLVTPTATVPSGGITPPAGTYTLRVTHIDAAGNASTPGTFTIVVELAPGLTYLGTSPTNDTTPEFSVTGLNQTNLTNEFRWLVDGTAQLPPFSNGTGAMWETFSQSTPSLSEGTHAIQVQQRRDDGSYADPSSSISIAIDVTPPTIPIFVATPPASTIDTQPSFTVQSSEAGVEFRYSVSGATTAGPLSRNDAGADGVETITLPVLNPGAHTVTVAALDTAGNQSTSNSFTVTVLETYNVTYNANGATGGTVPADQTKIEGTPLTLAANSGGLARTGYAFIGWNTNAAGTGTPYPAGGSYGTDAAVDLYAEWSANTYTVTLNRDGGSGGTASVNAMYDSAMPTATAPTRTGYTFDGYYTGIGGSGTQYYTNTMVSARAWDIPANTTLYAAWTGNTYTVTLNPNGGSGGTASVNATFGSAMPAATAPTLSGLTFDGYNTAVDGSGTEYYTNAMTSARGWDVPANTTLYAQWVYALGSTGPAGGTVFYDKGTYSNGWRYLEAAPRSTEWVDKKFGGYNTDVPSAENTGVGTGLDNTTAIVNLYGANEPYEGLTDYAAKLCDDLSYGGYSDWFLPSLNDLNAMYQQFSGDYVAAGVTSLFWSSSEITAINAYAYRLDTWTGQPYGKAYLARVRAIRRF